MPRVYHFWAITNVSVRTDTQANGVSSSTTPVIASHVPITEAARMFTLVSGARVPNLIPEPRVSSELTFVAATPALTAVLASPSSQTMYVSAQFYSPVNSVRTLLTTAQTARVRTAVSA